MTDWGRGEYELTAERLAPAADVAVAALSLERGERVLDVGCGTGNAALAAARMGAAAVGVDLAERLLEVARGQAGAEGLDAEFVAGDAVALPFEDGSFDAAVSVFGVIFSDAQAAAGELLRVVRPGGRVVVTTWTSHGPNPKVMEAVREALGGPPSPPRWSDPAVLRSLFEPHDVSVEEVPLPFTAPSTEAFVAEHFDHHPMWLDIAPALEAQGKLEQVRARTTEIFEAANEDPAAFRTTSRYYVCKVTVC